MATKLKVSAKGNEWSLLRLYLDGKEYKEIASELNMTPQQVGKFIGDTCKALFQTFETRKLLESQTRDLGNKRFYWSPLKTFDSQINKKFIEQLSDPESACLTEPERIFCYMMVYKGNEVEALKESGLGEGLTRNLKKEDYERLASLRCTYLLAKPNLMSYMRDLQLDYAKQINVSKETIQAEILKTISNLRSQNATKNAPTIAKLLNDLGRTEGVFVDKTEIDNKFSLDDSFDLMVQRRKELAKATGKAELVPTDVVPMALTSTGSYVDPSVYEEVSHGEESNT